MPLRFEQLPNHANIALYRFSTTAPKPLCVVNAVLILLYTNPAPLLKVISLILIAEIPCTRRFQPDFQHQLPSSCAPCFLACPLSLSVTAVLWIISNLGVF
jgi:hypothetical protein